MLRLHRPPASCAPPATPASDLAEARFPFPAEAAAPEAGPPGERRRFRRAPLNQQIGLGGSGLSPRADLIDGSASGLFLRVDGARRPEAGESVLLHFEAAGRGGPARSNAQRQAHVVRCLSHAGAHYVAVCFATPDALRLGRASLG